MTKDDALKLAQRLCEEALPKFNWGASALDANAITLLNTVPSAIKKALAQPDRSYTAADVLEAHTRGYELGMKQQPEQEPVHQWREKHSAYWYDGYPDNDDGGGPYETRTLYTTPPAAQRQWVGLTKADINEIWKGEPMLLPWDMTRTLAIEQRLKEKNT